MVWSWCDGGMMGGYDLIGHTLWYTADSTMPAWGLLFTFPFRWLPYPAVWYTWVFFSLVTVGICMFVFGTRSKLLAVALSYSMIAGLWYGQTEPLILAGIALGWLVVQRKAHPAFMGVAWMLMLIKPQVGLLPAILFAFWLWESKTHGALLSACLVATTIFLLSVAIWPQWISNYAAMSAAFIPPETNGAIWPAGLVALPLVMWPGLSRLARLRVALAVNLIASPYVQSYHAVVSLAVSGSMFGALVSWLPLAVNLQHIAWLIPAAVLVGEFAGSAFKSLWQGRLSAEPGLPPPPHVRGLGVPGHARGE